MKNYDRPAREIDKFRRLAREVITHHFGKATRLTYLDSGLTNFAYSFRVKEGDFFIRISPDANRMNLFIKEQWAVNAARAERIPVPEILEVGSDLIGFPYMVAEAVDGSIALNHPDRLAVLRELGSLAARINAIRTKGFGPTFDWSDNKLSKNLDFKDWLYGEYDSNGRLELLEKKKMLSASRIRSIKKIFKEAASSSARPVLNHSDLRLKNVIVSEKGKIAAVIDWESCMSNVPAWELSIAMHDLGIDGIQYFLEGYDLGAKKLEDQMPLIRAFNITNYSAAVGHAVKDKKLLEHYRLRLNGLLDLYAF